MFRNIEKRKIFGTIIGIIAFLLLLISASYAWFQWNSTESQKTNVKLTVSKDLSGYIVYNAGESILSTENRKLSPGTEYTDGISTTIELWKKPTVKTTIYGQISMEILSMLSIFDTTDANISKSETIKWAVTTYTATDSTEQILSQGNFIDKQTRDKFTITQDFELNNYQTFYKIYIWFDLEAIDEYYPVSGEFLSTEISVSATDIRSQYAPNAPELVDGLIPVYYNEDTKKWVTTDESNTGEIWYNYGQKKWANAILVDSSVRESYQTTETPVDISKVLAFYVWIPRYKYKVWNINKVVGTDTYDAYNTGIDIIFENGTETSGTITCNDYDFTVTEGNGLSETCSDKVDGNGYYTHPAFTFGEDEIQGFWMGKFEISNSTSLVKILPNVQSLRSQTVSTFWSAIYNMQSSNNAYGLSTNRTKVDSHMLTNMEWGAVAYLTHSDYGRCSNGACTEVAINNSSGYITGRSAGAPGSSATVDSANGTYKYDENKIETVAVPGTGTEVTPTISHDATYPWTENNGVYSSGNAAVDGTTSSLTYTFTLSGTGLVSFEYTASSEKNNDILSYTITNSQGVISVTGDRLSGTDRGTIESSLSYESRTHVLPAETYTLMFKYQKNSSTASGLDKGYVENVTILNGISTETNNSGPGGQLASTTGNIYGVYDMSGGAYEYVMGNMGSSDTAGTSYTYYASSAGTNYTYEGYEKYVTTYSYGTNTSNQNAYNRGRLGDATAEIVLTASNAGGWYGDSLVFPRSSNSWFYRGGYYSGTNAGVMNFNRNYGDSVSSGSSRAALIGF